MKRLLLIALALATMLTGCMRQNQDPTPSSSPAALPSASPLPTHLQSAPPIPAASATAQSTADQAAAGSVTEKGMQRDIDKLKAESEEQKGQEANYKNQNKEQLITVNTVTATELTFAGNSQVFKGDYTGQFVPGKKYKYFEDASAGGKRYYNVMDEFGVWIVFMYQVKF